MASPGNRVPTVTLYADQDEIKTAFEIATKAHVCITCGKPFSLLESMGALDCWQHPGFLQANGKWSCCGKKIHTPRWSDHKPILKLYDNCQSPFNCATVKGCQKCDHNTSDEPFTHKDGQPIAELSALLPFINQEYPFILRPGFDEGVLRRCKPQIIVIPERAQAVQYQNTDGNVSEYNVETGGQIPYGFVISAMDKNGKKITEWIK
jgi:hypothetical protein